MYKFINNKRDYATKPGFYRLHLSWSETIFLFFVKVALTWFTKN